MKLGNPTYEHDEKAYLAACKTLGFVTPPSTPLPEFVYQTLAGDLVEDPETGKLSYDPTDFAKQMTEIFAEGGEKMVPPIPAVGLGIFLKNMLLGMHSAAANGFTESPTGIALSPAGNSLLTVEHSKAGGLKLFLQGGDGLAVAMNGLQEHEMQQESSRQKRLVFLREQKDMRRTGYYLQVMSHIMQTEPQVSRDEASARAGEAVREWGRGAGRHNDN